MHSAALMYVKNVLLLGENRSGMLHHVHNQAYNHLLQHDTIMKERSDDSTGLDSDGHSIQSGATIHTEEEKNEEGQVEEDEEVSLKDKKVEDDMMEVLDNMIPDDDRLWAPLIQGGHKPPTVHCHSVY